MRRVLARGRYGIAHQPVEHAARLLGVHEIFIYVARIRQRVFKRLFGNFVEFYPAVFFLVELEHLRKVPADGLALPVRVGREIYLFRLFGLFLQSLDVLFLIGVDYVSRFKIVRYVHAHVIHGQIPHVAFRGIHFVFSAQKFFDCLCLVRRFDDNKFHDPAPFYNTS